MFIYAFSVLAFSVLCGMWNERFDTGQILLLLRNVELRKMSMRIGLLPSDSMIIKPTHSHNIRNILSYYRRSKIASAKYHKYVMSELTNNLFLLNLA